LTNANILLLHHIPRMRSSFSQTLDEQARGERAKKQINRPRGANQPVSETACAHSCHQHQNQTWWQ